MGERVFQNPGVCGQALPSFPSPTPFLPPFCSHPIYAKTPSRGPNFVRSVRERLLRRLRQVSHSLLARGHQLSFIQTNLQ